MVIVYHDVNYIYKLLHSYNQIQIANYHQIKIKDLLDEKVMYFLMFLMVISFLLKYNMIQYVIYFLLQ